MPTIREFFSEEKEFETLNNYQWGCLGRRLSRSYKATHYKKPPIKDEFVLSRSLDYPSEFLESRGKAVAKKFIKQMQQFKPLTIDEVLDVLFLVYENGHADKKFKQMAKNVLERSGHI